MKTTPFFYFSGERAYMLVFLEYAWEIPRSTLSKLYKDLEVISDSRLNLVAMRFDLTIGAGKIMDTIVNNWALTETGENLSGQEQEQLIAYCKDLKENGKSYPGNISGSKEDTKYHSRFKEMCRDIDCLMVLVGGKFVAD